MQTYVDMNKCNVCMHACNCIYVICVCDIYIYIYIHLLLKITIDMGFISAQLFIYIIPMLNITCGASNSMAAIWWPKWYFHFYICDLTVWLGLLTSYILVDKVSCGIILDPWCHFPLNEGHISSFKYQLNLLYRCHIMLGHYDMSIWSLWHL